MTDFPALTEAATRRATDWLGHAGLRPTRQRVTLAALLMGDGQDRHVTAEGLYEAAGTREAGVSLATVYNTLRAFCDAGVLREITVDGAKSYFDTDMHDHPHYFWEDTSELSDAPREALDIRGLPAAPEGAELVAVDVILRLRKSDG
ncbi:transcriptional repressor [Salipiger sp. IMCC34102]|uniref:iron response transcriptional regulator IrrA n=1 Tax=Salipiger sp. IMCC34102 TaxID=2510647 RepID=UPI00101BA98E|nr:transcriptional repressor [Salipiger sp. IMCC34102]RYH01940.1 transcriptional repressor [Salipiger sp. IMCC34102]